MKFKNMSTLIACGALVAAIGAVSVSASSPFTTQQVKVEDGVKQHSTDDGRTWSTEAGRPSRPVDQGGGRRGTSSRPGKTAE